jgi:hypothetical protein
MSSNEMNDESDLGLSPAEQGTLLDVALRAIDHGLSTGQRLEPDAAAYPPRLRSPRATFVTLRIEAKLRGCMGALSASEPLVRDVAHNGYSSAFCDTRFPKLRRAEVRQIDVHISILTAPEPFRVESEADLLQQMRPGVDGLILFEGSRKGTLLPAVWEGVSDPRIFLEHLKHKAGLPPDYWSTTIRFERYTTSSINRSAGQRG